MRRSTCLVAVAALAAFLAQVPAARADNSQQAKMTSCNADASAKQLSGEDRKAFMSKCLSKGSSTSTSGNSQQEKMKSCNAEANTKSLKGDDRKSFMSTCLKGSGNSVH
jgi:hypothetical protein